jgi:hypothetical protein
VFNRYLTSLATVLAAGALAACQGKDTNRTGAPAGDGAQAATASDAATGVRVLTVVAKEYSFDAPAEIPAGLTTIRIVSEGRELHHVSLIKLNEGKTIQDLQKALQGPPGPFPSWAVEYGGTNPPHPNGGVAEVTQVLEPGRYVMVCLVPSPDGTPHVVKGMMRALEVTPSTAPVAEEPKADIVMTLSDYTFGLSAPLTAGKHVIRVDNNGPQPHEVVLVKLAPGKRATDVAAWVEKMVGPPPGEPMGGLAGTHSGGYGYMAVDLTPGEYALLCFLPDTKDGKPHVAHGMVKQITVS